jgi:calcium-dependent protein kinase
MHRDLKPENILLEKDKDFSQIKVVDFGTALSFVNKEHFYEQIGTPYYIAPEVINHDYGKECDIWSTGVICYILISGWAPFDGDTTDDIIKSI